MTGPARAGRRFGAGRVVSGAPLACLVVAIMVAPVAPAEAEGQTCSVPRWSVDCGVAPAGAEGQTVILHTYVHGLPAADAITEAAWSVGGAVQAAYDMGATGVWALDYVYQAGIDGRATVVQLTEVMFARPGAAHSFAAAVNYPAGSTTAYVVGAGAPRMPEAGPSVHATKSESVPLVTDGLSVRVAADVYEDRMVVRLAAINHGDDRIYSLLLASLVAGDLRIGQTVNVTDRLFGDTHGELHIAGVVLDAVPHADAAASGSFDPYVACSEEGLRPTAHNKQNANPRAGTHSVSPSYYEATGDCAGGVVKLVGFSKPSEVPGIERRIWHASYLKHAENAGLSFMQRMVVTIYAAEGSLFDLGAAVASADFVSVSVAGVTADGSVLVSKVANGTIAGR